MKEYVLWISRPGEEQQRVTKTEEELTKQDYNLFLGDLINAFNKCPQRTKIEFLHKIYMDKLEGEKAEEGFKIYKNYEG